VLEPLLVRGHPAAASKVRLRFSSLLHLVFDASLSTQIGTGLRAFQVREHPEHGSRCFFVVRTDGSAEDFSYRKCAEALFPSAGSDAPASALRRGVRGEGGAKRGRGSGAARPSGGGGATRGGSFGSGGARRSEAPAGEGGGAGRGGGGGRGGGSRGRGARGRGRGRR